MATYTNPTWQGTFGQNHPTEPGHATGIYIQPVSGAADSPPEPTGWTFYNCLIGGVFYPTWYHGTGSSYLYSDAADVLVSETTPWNRCGYITGGVITFQDPCECLPCVGFGYSGECYALTPVCPAGTVFVAANGLCRSGTEDGSTCPPGTVWDPVCAVCRKPPRPCWTWNTSSCSWVPPSTSCASPKWYDFGVCACVCPTPHPTCPTGYYYDTATCSCIPCPAGTCYCASAGNCVSCTPPPCSDELTCVWNTATCAWDCDDPACPTGQEWYWEPICACRPICTPGECWCETEADCVPCSNPPCKDALHCVWNPLTCVWDCDDPTEPGFCGSGEWSWTTCSCEGGQGGLWNLVDRWQRYHVAEATTGGIRYRRSNHSTPPFALNVLATDQAGDEHPRMVYTHRERLDMVFARDGNSMLTVSHDDGATWGTPVNIISGSSRPTVVFDPRSKATFYAAYKGGKLAGRLQPQGQALGPEFFFKDAAGADLLVEDDSFQIAPVGDKPSRWLLVVRIDGSTASSNWQSWSDGTSWKEIT